MATAVSVQDRLEALVRGIELVVQEGAVWEEGKTHASLFVQTFVILRNELYAYVAAFGSMLKGKVDAAMSSQVLDANKEDLAKTTTSISDLAAMLKVSFPNGAPWLVSLGRLPKWNDPNSS